jgi:predicted Ser/Thr protein kinase
VYKEAKLTLRRMLNERGYSAKAADELWKWYDFSKKKGVASF